MEVSTLKADAARARIAGRSPLLRLQSDERLVALTRRGNHAAFETLVARYQARLGGFCRHMLGSREDAEDVLQEVFAAAFNALQADDRPILVRPWLYRIARNRSLNHLRKQKAIGVDSMDVHLADQGLTTADKVHKREEFRLLMADVENLAETQRTALLLREMEHLSYEQIALAMDTTVPAVKSLLVRARMGLAEASEARLLTCDEVRLELGEAAEGLKRLSAPVRRHVRDCERCAAFRDHLRTTNKTLAAMFPVTGLLLFKNAVLGWFGHGAAGSGGAAAGGGAAGAAGAAGAVGGAAASTGAATGIGAAVSSAASAGLGAVATKAAAGLAAAAVVTAGAVEARHEASPARHAASTAAVSRPAYAVPQAPVVPAPLPKPAHRTAARKAAPAPAPREKATAEAPKQDAAPKPETKPTVTTVAAVPSVPAPPVPAVPAPTQTVSDTATLPDDSGQPLGPAPSDESAPATTMTSSPTSTTLQPGSSDGTTTQSGPPPSSGSEQTPPPAGQSTQPAPPSGQ
jgi:RNA polymerase sigma factor (sigma-70 family)